MENEIIYCLYFDPCPVRSDSVEVRCSFVPHKFLNGLSSDAFHSDGFHIRWLPVSVIQFKKKLSCLEFYLQVIDWLDLPQIGHLLIKAKVTVSKTNLWEQFLWLVFIWCITHQLELALSDTISITEFADVNEMLLRIYYLYKRASQKLSQLREMHEIYKQTLGFEIGDCKLKKANGTCWILHRLETMEMCLDKRSLHIERLEHLSSDKIIPSKDRQKLIGYLIKWKQERMPLMLAMFIDC